MNNQDKESILSHLLINDKIHYIQMINKTTLHLKEIFNLQEVKADKIIYPSLIH